MIQVMLLVNYRCDLAGSERLKKTLAEGERLSEAQHINSSLLELGWEHILLFSLAWVAGVYYQKHAKGTKLRATVKNKGQWTGGRGPFLPTLYPSFAHPLPTSSIFWSQQVAYSKSNELTNWLDLLFGSLSLISCLSQQISSQTVRNKWRILLTSRPRDKCRRADDKSKKSFVWPEQRFANKVGQCVALVNCYILFNKTIRSLSFEGKMKRTTWLKEDLCI